MKAKTICFDLDGVLCDQTEGDYENASPNRPAIDAVNRLYDQGFRIIVHTARFMGRVHENPVEAYKIGFEFTKRQLAEWGVRYHDLFMGKPKYDLVIDDRSLFYNEDWWRMEFKEMEPSLFRG